MNYRWLAAIPGILGAYLLVHAGFAAVGAIDMHDGLLQPASGVDIYTPEEMRKTYEILLVTSAIFGTFAMLSIATCVGFLRASAWARRLWIGTSLLMVIGILFFTGLLNWKWTAHTYELSMIALSWAALAIPSLSQRRRAMAWTPPT